MASFDVTNDIDKALKGLTALDAKNISFAVARAMTLTGQYTQVKLKAAMQREIDRPTPYTLNSSTSSPTKMTNVNTVGLPEIPSSDAYVVPEYDDSEVIGGPVHYGESLMTIDFTILKEKIAEVITDSDFLRMKGPIQNVNAIVQEACEMIVSDYVCILDLVPAPTDLVTPNLAATGTGNIAFANKGDIVNGVIPQLYEDNDPEKPIIGPAISFKILDKSTPPQSGVIEKIIIYL